MRASLILLMFLAGCANHQHKHPHDHGLSAHKGQLARIAEDNLSMFRRFQSLQIKVDQERVKNVALESRLNAAEAALLKMDILEDSVTRMDKKLVSLERTQNSSYADMVAWFASVEKDIKENKKLIDWLATMMETNKQDIDKLKPQPLIELKDEED